MENYMPIALSKHTELLMSAIFMFPSSVEDEHEPLIQNQVNDNTAIDQQQQVIMTAHWPRTGPYPLHYTA